jgi:hypothetical protein
MPSPNDVQFNPPESWDAFEAICADLFALEWDYPEAVRYGRTGQRQNGVDIYGKEHGDDVGAQCKGKRNWPPTKLTTTEIDDEVAKAREFNPKLKKYFIVTTADNDVHLIDHANAITAQHAGTGEFSVHVYGWGELIRRIRKYPEILNTHFGVYSLQKVRDDIRAVPNAVIGGVMELLQPVIAAVADDTARREIPTPKPVLDESLGQALERYYDDRYRTILKRSMFPEVNDSDEFTPLAREVLESAGTALSASLRRTILLRASRWTALRNKLGDAELFFAEADKLVGPESDKPARARLAVARGDTQHAIQLLRDERDADSQSVLFGILAAAQDDDRALAWFKESSLPVVGLTSTGIMTACQIHAVTWKPLEMCLQVSVRNNLLKRRIFISFVARSGFHWYYRVPNNSWRC